jgi:ribosomal protein S27AE
MGCPATPARSEGKGLRRFRASEAGGIPILPSPTTKRFCPKCGTEMVFFLQHAHGNYPLLDYLCPKCELGEEPEGGGAVAEDEG